MYNENIGIDEATPIIYAVKIRTGLQAFVRNLIKVFFEVRTLFLNGIEEKHTGIET